MKLKKIRLFLATQFKKLWELLNVMKKSESYQPAYRILSIAQDEDENYIATIQMINKSYVFKKHPEEILSNDEMTDLFSPRDVRTLTYLGYLSVNAPKYKILAKRLSESDSKITFALKQKGKREPIIKTADEIATDSQILSGLNQKDAHMIGFIRASDSIANEEQQKQEALRQLTQAQTNRLPKEDKN